MTIPRHEFEKAVEEGFESARDCPSAPMRVSEALQVNFLLALGRLQLDLADVRRPVFAGFDGQGSDLLVACNDGTVWIVEDGKASFQCVIPGTPAALAGVKQGDI